MSFDDTHSMKMKAILSRLFDTESPPGGTLAFEAIVYLRSGKQINGALTVHEVEIDGFRYEALKLAQPAMAPHPDYPNQPAMARKIIAEHYFDYEDVEAVIVVRDVNPNMITDKPKSSIILGG